MNVKGRALAGALGGAGGTLILSGLRDAWSRMVLLPLLDRAVYGTAWGLSYWILNRRQA